MKAEQILKLAGLFVKKIAEWEEHLPGGLAAGMTPDEFDQKALREGVEVEYEHIDEEEDDGEDIATEIAMDHLVEHPGRGDRSKEPKSLDDFDYYEKLRFIESGGHEEEE